MRVFVSECVLTAVVKLAAWARSVGVHPQTAYAWVREDRMQVPFRRLPSGTILVDVAVPTGDQRVMLYAQVSSHDQRTDLDRQVSRLTGGPRPVGSMSRRSLPKSVQG
jgi:putative resolvase